MSSGRAAQFSYILWLLQKTWRSCPHTGSNAGRLPLQPGINAGTVLVHRAPEQRYG